MGGPIWKDPEENIFWYMARYFPTGIDRQTKAAKKNHKKVEEDYKPFIRFMQDEWRRRFPGQNPPRKYTAISLYEHYFQNYILNKPSPHARRHIKKYLAWVQQQARNAGFVSGTEHSASNESSESVATETEGTKRKRGQRRAQRQLPRPARASAGGPSQAPQTAQVAGKADDDVSPENLNKRRVELEEQWAQHIAVAKRLRMIEDA